MIAKRIAARTGGRGFAGLSRYVVDAKGRPDPATWTRTADYILDTAHGGAKVSGVRVTNCGTDDPAVAAMTVLATQDAYEHRPGRKSKRERDYHLVISFPPGERPAASVLRDVEDRLVAAIGFADHQRLSAVHNDTEHLHIHVAINKVHPGTLRNVEPYFDKQRLMETCEALELRYGLTRTNHGIEIGRPVDTKENAHERPHEVQQHDAHTLAVLRESYAEAIAQEPDAQSLNGVRNLSRVGVVRNTGSGEVLLPSDEANHLERGGTQRDDALRWPGNGDRGARSGDSESAEVKGRAADLEAHSGCESFTRWARETARPALLAALDAGSWEALHKAAAKHGMAIRQRGAGLVALDVASGTAIKASSIDRALSIKALTARLGTFKPGRDAAAKPATRYTRAPLHTAPASETLYAAFQRSRSNAIEARAKARDALRQADSAYTTKLRKWYQEKTAHLKVRTDLNRTAKRAAWKALFAERAADYAQHRAQRAEQRAQDNKAHPLPTWQDFLARAAVGGDADALAVLRSRQQKQDRFTRSLIDAADPDKAKQIVFKHAKPHAMKNGHVLYETEDGGRVVDRARDVRVDANTEAAMVLALSLAKERFAGQALRIEGDAAFRTAAVRAAVAHGVDVRFADAGMEAMRQSAATARGMKAEHAPTALQAFINQRNESRARLSDISYHRAWVPTDAGACQYQGRRRLGDGSEAVLLQHGDTTLVKPVTAAQAAKASTWKRGATVTVDGRGRFTETPAATHKSKGPKR